MPANNTEIEKRLWDAADEFRANSKLKSSEYSVPVLGLIFLRYADQKYAQAEKELNVGAESASRRRRAIGKTDYQARGVMYLPPEGGQHGHSVSGHGGSRVAPIRIGWGDYLLAEAVQGGFAAPLLAGGPAPKGVE